VTFSKFEDLQMSYKFWDFLGESRNNVSNIWTGSFNIILPTHLESEMNSPSSEMARTFLTKNP
jgi:hypothetical protein